MLQIGRHLAHAYVNWYITQMSLAWGRFVDGGLLANWKIDKVSNQRRFFDTHIQTWLKEAENRKAFVIISDAFRFEAAEELTRELNGTYRLKADISSQLGVLPSYTRLGMAICGNCPKKDAFGALFDSERPQNRSSIMQISRTADTRQAYRIDGVLEGRFRSVAPQGTDLVYDTVAFREVPSWLARARGSLAKLEQLLAECDDAETVDECRRLVKLSHQAAQRLRKFVRSDNVTEKDIPKKLSKNALWPRLMSRDVKGKVVGQARLSLRLLIKNVWDYPEMQRRGMSAHPAERSRTLQELKTIVATAKDILAKLNGA